MRSRPATPTAAPSPYPQGRGWSGLVLPALTLGAAIGTCVFVVAADPTTPGGASPPCPTKTLFGIVCPGCGTARMVHSLLHGDLRAALSYNAVGLLVLLLLLWSYLAWSLRRVTGRRIPRWESWRWAPVAVGAVTAAWLVVRNLPCAPFTALAV